MRTASSAFKEKVKSSSRNFINTAVITLASQEVLTVTNANILFDGLEVEDSVGSDNTFDALGSTIINKCTLVLYNGDESYSTYDFDGAKVIVSTGLVINGTTEPIQLGEFTVEEANYTTNSIVLSMLDNMSKFDKPYSESSLVYPATFAQIVSDACTTCGVTFNYAGSDFTYDTFSVATKPDGNSCTFRNVIGWVATINGTFARCNSLGQLEFKWFDLSGRPIPTDNIIVVDENNVEHEHVSLVLSDNTLVDTISYLPGKNTSLPEVKSLFSQDIAVTDITITGVTITIANIADEADITSSIGTDDYRIVVADNPFITADNIEDVRDQIADKVLDLSFRKCSVKCVSNPLLEAGDTAYLVDTKGNEHRILLTRVTFSPTANQTIVCGADTPNRKSAALYSANTRTVAQMKSQVRALRDRMANVETIAGDTNQYFWFTETGTDTGAHITEVPQEDFTDSTSQNYHTGYNALFRSIGLAIRNGLTELATFSANSIRLGVSNAKHILINPDGISLFSAANTLLSSFTAGGVALYVSGTIRALLSTSGLIVYGADGQTALASFGATNVLGNNNGSHLEQSSSGIRVVGANNTDSINIGAQSSTILWEETNFIVAGYTVDEDNIVTDTNEIILSVDLASGQNMTLTIGATTHSIPTKQTFTYTDTNYTVSYDGEYTLLVTNLSTDEISATLRYPITQPINYGITARTTDATRIKARTVVNDVLIAETGLYSNAAGNAGLFDAKRGKWIVFNDVSGNTKIPALTPKLLYASKVSAPTTKGSWNYMDIQLSEWAVIAIRANVHNVIQFLVFFSTASQLNQQISDRPTQTVYVRGGFMANWSTNRIYVRWLDGTAEHHEVSFDRVYGLVRK